MFRASGGTPSDDSSEVKRTVCSGRRQAETRELEGETWEGRQWPAGSANGPERLGPEGSEPLTPRKRRARFLEKTLTGRPPRILRGRLLLSGAPAVPNPAPGPTWVPLAPSPPLPPGSPAPPRVAAHSPPPTQPRERTAGTEFNRHHQQPPGKLRKVDTLIPGTVSGERPGAAPCSCQVGLRERGWGPTPTGPSPSLASAMVRSL